VTDYYKRDNEMRHHRPSVLIGCLPIILLACAPGTEPSAPAIRLGSVVLIGDSRVAQDPIETLCGRPVLKIGVGGDSFDAFSRAVPWAALRQALPVAIYVAIGINFSYLGQETPADLWMLSWERFIDDLRTLGAPVYVVTIAPAEPYDAGLTSNQVWVDWVNNAMRTVTQTRRWPLIDLDPLVRAVHQDPTGRYTYDGIHFVPAWYTTLHQAYGQHCPI